METQIIRGTLERSNFAELRLDPERINQETQAQEEK